MVAARLLAVAADTESPSPMQASGNPETDGQCHRRTGHYPCSVEDSAARGPLRQVDIDHHADKRGGADEHNRKHVRPGYIYSARRGQDHQRGY